MSTEIKWVWTPRTTKGDRLEFDRADVEFIRHAPREKGAGYGLVKIGGKEYRYRSAACGSGCRCDAVLLGWKADGLPHA